MITLINLLKHENFKNFNFTDPFDDGIGMPEGK